MLALWVVSKVADLQHYLDELDKRLSRVQETNMPVSALTGT